ncbi:DUF6702 family protein [Pedobacter sp. GR22-6]|uniref:DUF6702 family protein n=1 Tax=Pedobacter sp. GR22-6 TaxID=3127957 RepID=UPI00307CFAB5
MLHILLISWLHLLHPFYVSVTEVEHNPKTKTVQMSVRVFFDDFEKALNKRYKTNVNILKPKDRKEIELMIAGYIKEHLVLKADDRLLTFKYIGYEIKEDAAWCYFESGQVESIRRLDIQDQLLFEQHESQINMIHAIVGGKRKSTKLDNPQSKAVFLF